MVGSTFVETILDVISWDEGVSSFSFNCSLLCEFWIPPLLCSVTKELPEESVGYIYIYIYIAVQYKG